MTTNASLVFANRRYLAAEPGTRFELPACLTDIFVATVLWANSPMEAKEHLRSRLIASCTSAVRPDPALEKRLIEEAKKQLAEHRIVPDDFVLLTTSFITRDLLADSTLNDKDSFSSATLEHILGEIQARIKSDAIEPYIKQQRQLEQEAAAAMAERENAVGVIERLISGRATSSARARTAVLWIIVAVLTLGPVAPTIFYHWLFILISAASSLCFSFLTFGKQLTPHKFYASEYVRAEKRWRKKLMGQPNPYKASESQETKVPPDNFFHCRSTG